LAVASTCLIEIKRERNEDLHPDVTLSRKTAPGQIQLS
jgi:hypothetical protein